MAIGNRVFRGRCRNGPWLGLELEFWAPVVAVPCKPKKGVYPLGRYNWHPGGWYWCKP